MTQFEIHAAAVEYARTRITPQFNRGDDRIDFVAHLELFATEMIALELEGYIKQLEK